MNVFEMKNQRLWIGVMIFLLASNLSFAKEEKILQDHEVISTISSAKKDLKEAIETDIKRSTGLDSFQFKLDIQVDSERLQSILGVSKEKYDNLENYKLPGFFIKEQGGYAISGLRKIKKQDVIRSIKKVNLNFSHSRKNYNEKMLKDLLLNSIINNVDHIKRSKVNIQIHKKASPFAKEEKLVDIMKKPLSISLLSKKLKVDFVKGNFAKFWDKHFKQVAPVAILGFVLLSFLGIGVFAWGIGKINSTIKDKKIDVTMPSGGNAPSQSIPLDTPQVSGGTGVVNEEFKSYIEVLETLKNTVKLESDLFMDMIMIASMTEDFVFLMILFDILNKADRSKLILSLEPKIQAKFKEFIVNHAMKSYENEAKLKAKAIKIIKLVKVSSLDPTKLYKIILSDYCSTVNPQHFCRFIEECDDKEVSFLIDIVDPAVISYAVNKGHIHSNAILNKSNVECTKQEVVELLVKLSHFVQNATVIEDDNKVHQVIAYMNSENEEKMIAELGIDARYTTQTLFNNHEEQAIHYLNNLNFDQMKSICALLPDEAIHTFISSLPELLQERMKIVRFKVTPVGGKLKSDFYLFLKKLDKELIDNHVEKNIGGNIPDFNKNEMYEDEEDIAA